MQVYEKTMNVKSVLGVMCIALALLACSCKTTSPSGYVPRQLGSIEQSNSNSRAMLTITPSKVRYEPGDPIEFTVTLENTSASPYWVPKNLVPVFVWNYSDGSRDGQLPRSNAPRPYQKDKSVLLQPGDELSSTRVVKTNYFLREGITEFHAILDIPENTNSQLSPFMSDKLLSNGYGVLVATSGRWRGDLDPSQLDSNLDLP